MRAVLIDDESFALDYLAYLLDEVGGYEVVGKYTKPYEAYEKMALKEVDVVFLDIEMPGMNGVELAEKLIEKSSRIQIVFVTAYDHYAIKAFELNSLDYLLKPIHIKRLIDTTERLKKHLAFTEEHQPLNKEEPFTFQLFHEPTIYNGDEEIPLHWRTSKAQQLFHYLVHHRNRTVSKDELIELLWHDFEIDRAYTQLYTTIYQARKTLQKCEGHLQILNVGEGYRIKYEGIRIDVDSFEAFLDVIPPISDQTIDQYETFIDLYKGEYFQGCDYTWIYPEEQRFRISWFSIKMKMIDWYRDQGLHQKSIDHALDIYQRNPFEEEGYVALMKSFASIGKSTAVKHYYNELKEMLSQELGVPMSAAVTRWYENWLNETEKI